MEDKKICQDLEEDEELASLRLAALATLKTRASKQSEPDAVTAKNILPINSITSTTEYSSDHTSRGNQHSWRNSGQPSRRRGSGKHFPKSSQRSNLIVITPVGADIKKDLTGKSTVPQLLLPQHRWCQAGNEDSSSPKTDRRTGPTRFNRHDSGSESSDSDFEDSDDDSYSNETVLQDERSRLTAEESNEGNTELKNGISSERRLSFQNLETDMNSDDVDKSGATTVYNCLQTTYPALLDDAQSDKEETELSTVSKSKNSVSNCSNHSDESTDERYSSIQAIAPPVLENGESTVETNSVKATSQRSKHTPIKFDVSDYTKLLHTIKLPSPDHRDNSRDTPHVFKDLRNHLDAERKSVESSEQKTSPLSKNDLRLELKKRKIANSDRPVLSSRQNKIADDRLYLQSKDRVNIHHRSRSRDRSSSRDRKNYKRSASRERSRTPKRKRSRYVRERMSSSRSSRSSSSSSSSSVTSSDSNPHSVSSVVRPVQSKIVVTETHNSLKSSIGMKNPFRTESDHLTLKKGKGIEIKLKTISNMKISVPGNDQRSIAPEIKKRGPVHMRLGALPRQRIIQMPKDVEAAFVSTSSDDDDVNIKCKKSNILVVTEVGGKKVDGISRHVEKKALESSDVPKTGRGKMLR